MRLLPLVLLVACGGGIEAVVDPDRPEHYFDVPFPSDDLLRDDLSADLAGFPEPVVDALLSDVIRGWKERAELASQGFANNGAFYFRFADDLDVPEGTDGSVDDDILLVDMDTGELLPLELTFYARAYDDPFVADHLLAGAPALGHPPRSGARLAAVVMRSAGVAPPPGYALPDGVEAALDLAGVRGRAAVATTFTVGDAIGQMRQLFSAADDWLGASPDWSSVSWQRVTRLDVAQGLTASENDATVFTVTFEGGGTEQSFLAPLDQDGDHSHDFADWPVAIYQAELPVPYFSGLADRPFMSPGLSHLSDTDVYTGWFAFSGGQLMTEPELDHTRVVLQVPLDDNGDPKPIEGILIYDHGTGGHAYNAVQRRNARDRGEDLAQIWVDAGWAVLSHDAPLYGTRYPLVDEGFTDGSLGFYNIVNLPAFRDNQRQTAVEGHVVRRFAQEGLPAQFADLEFRSTRVRKIGHSLGSVTTHLSVAPEADAYEAVLGSGSGGVFTHYILDTGLLNSSDTNLAGLIVPLLGFDPDDAPSVPEMIGASFGLEEDESRQQVGRLHPSLMLFQWNMDPSDPMAVAPDEDLPVTLLTGIGDWQVPNLTSEALAVAVPSGQVALCTPLGDYDPHYCMHREDEGLQIVRDWLAP